MTAPAGGCGAEPGLEALQLSSRSNLNQGLHLPVAEQREEILEMIGGKKEQLCFFELKQEKSGIWSFCD